MKEFKFYILVLTVLFLTVGCCSSQRTYVQTNPDSINSLKFVGEIVIPTGTIYNNTVVGGLSGIDFANDKYFAISDDKMKPVRIYEFDIKYNSNKILNFNIVGMISIDIGESFIDPESVRFDKFTNNFFWTSEGAIRKGISPSVFRIDKKGAIIKKYKTPPIFQVTEDLDIGPRQNGTFECLSMSQDNNSFWVGMELPLKQDGEEPKLKNTYSPTRISKVNKETGEIEFQFAYFLDPIPKDSKPKGKFRVNGLPEILSIDDNSFLFIERAYASGYSNGGNTVKIYKVDATNATDIKSIKSLKNGRFNPASKTILFDFESIRSKLTEGIVDNIEGITFGPTLQNGHRTIVVVSDNNFCKFSPQLNQIIVLEVIP